MHLNLPVLHRLRHGRVAQQEGAADREACVAQQEGAADREAYVADNSCVYEVTETGLPRSEQKTNKTNINSTEYRPWIGTKIDLEYWKTMQESLFFPNVKKCESLFHLRGK